MSVCSFGLDAHLLNADDTIEQVDFLKVLKNLYGTKVPTALSQRVYGIPNSWGML